MTPEELLTVTFPMSRLGRRGYEEEPVREFLRAVHAEFVRLVNEFDAAAWNAPSLELAGAIVGTCCTVDTDLPRIRFVMDPLKPVFQGTRRIRESRTDE